MNLQINNVPLRERAEQDRLAELYARIERDRQARVRELRYRRNIKELEKVLAPPR